MARALYEQRLRNWSEAKECTFKPDLSLSTSSLCLHAGDSSSSRRAPRPAAAAQPPAPSFCPRTNDVAHRMHRARGYLSQGVFERLARAPDCATFSSSPPRRPHEDTLLSSITRRSPSAEPHSHTGSGGSVDRGGAGAVLQSFLQRQSESEEDRLRRLEELETALEPPWRPELCDRSRRLAARQRSASADGGDCRDHFASGFGSTAGASTSRLRSSSADFPFRPAIGRASSRRAARGLDELSCGDWERRQGRVAAHRELLRREVEQQLPFAPQLRHDTSRQAASGRLRVLEDPDAYMARVSKAQDQADAVRAQASSAREEHLLAECTFYPQVNQGAPPFVRRLAAAHRAARAATAAARAAAAAALPDSVHARAAPAEGVSLT